MKRLKTLKKGLCFLIFLMGIGIFSVFGVNAYVCRVGEAGLTDTPEHSDAILVLGASVHGTTVSQTLAKRLDTAYQMYQNGCAENIIVSGDHGTKDYNEVKAMQQYLLEKGVPEERIFMDHAGFSTYDSVYRAKEIFQVKKALIVTQREHLIRALYIAEQLGLSACGVVAEKYHGGELEMQKIREVFARIKAFLQCEILHSEPMFLGEAIPVSDTDGRVTDDGLTED